MLLAAFALTAVMGMSSLAVEVGSGYATKVRNQRVADMAALGAALAYKNGGQSTATAQQVAQDIVVANGLPASSATVYVPVTIGTTTAVQVVITTAVPIKLGSFLTSSPTYNVTNVAAASLTTSGGGGCITALGTSSTAVSATGGASILANNCGVSTNGTVYSANTSAKVTAKSITAAVINDASSSWGGHGITTTPSANNFTVKANGASDGVIGGSDVKQALCYVNKLTLQSDSDYADNNTTCTSQLATTTSPGASGSTTDVNFVSGTPAPGYATYYNSGTKTYTLPGGPYTFRNITIGGGVTVNFGNGDLRADSITHNGSAVIIGNGSVVITNALTYGSGSLTIGNGTHYFGTLSVCGGCTLTVGSGNFSVQNTLTESGGSYIRIGLASDDNVTISNSGNATNAIDVSGGSWLCFTAGCTTPSAAAGKFSVNGSIATSGGSGLITPIAATHVINGDLNLNGSSTLGSGLYVIKGNFTNNTGGTMTGVAVTFALGGTFNLAGGTTVDLAAPPAGSAYGITDMLVLTKSTAGTTIGGGSSDKYSGMVYAPKSALSVSGGASISANGSACLMVTVSTVAVSGSGVLNSSGCSSLSSGGGATVALIQ